MRLSSYCLDIFNLCRFMVCCGPGPSCSFMPLLLPIILWLFCFWCYDSKRRSNWKLQQNKRFWINVPAVCRFYWVYFGFILITILFPAWFSQLSSMQLLSSAFNLGSFIFTVAQFPAKTWNQISAVSNYLQLPRLNSNRLEECLWKSQHLVFRVSRPNFGGAL